MWLVFTTLSALVGTSPHGARLAAKKESEALRQLDGVWELKSCVAATPAGVVLVDLDAPNVPRVSLTIKDGVQDTTADGKSAGQLTLKLGPEDECLVLCGPPNETPRKVRFRLAGDTLIVVQDEAFKAECPESFDADRGRLRDRRILAFTRAAQAAPVGRGVTKEERERETLRRLEGVWELKSCVAALPAGPVVLDLRNASKIGLTIKDGVQDSTVDGKSLGRVTLKLGPEDECLLMCGPPELKPHKERFRLAGDTLVIVQDMAFKEECPESFHADKGRLRDRRILTFTRAPAKP
jgi:hypothetical protein